MFRITIMFAAILLAMTPELLAQKKAKTPAGSPPVEVTVTQVNDRRGGKFFERLGLVVQMPKISAGDVSAARVFLRSATDDTGRNLIPENAGEPGLETIGGAGLSDEDERKKPARISFDLEPPARTASFVKEVRGEIELYMPSKDPNSVALVPKFLSSKGKALSHRALKSNGVEITMVSDQQYEAEKKRLAEVKRQEMKKEEYSDESIESILVSFLELFPTPEANDVVVKIKDPKNLVQEIAYIDSSGQPKRLFMREDEGFTFLSTWEGSPAADWGLRVSMKTPKNLVRYPFVLTNVPLP